MAIDFTSRPGILSSSFQGIHVEVFLKGKFLVIVSRCLTDGPPALTEGSFSPPTISTLAGRELMASHVYSPMLGHALRRYSGIGPGPSRDGHLTEMIIIVMD